VRITAVAVLIVLGGCYRDTAPEPSASKPEAEEASRAPAATDASFVEAMISHHHDAIHMAEHEAARGADPEIVAMARRIRAEQQADLARLESVRADLVRGPVKRPAEPSHREMAEGMRHMEQLSGAALDRHFAEMMISHHQQGIAMIDSSLGELRDSRLRDMATRMRESQMREVEDLRRELRDLQAAPAL
jgi:uncharacterized protein (DUF305 family)